MKSRIYSLIVIGMVLCGVDSSAQTVSGKTGGHEYVDLGLPSGLKWATCNVGAEKATEFGDFFAWGEVVPKKEYNWNSYKWSSIVKLANSNFKRRQIKYCANSIIVRDGNTYMPKEGLPDTLSTLLSQDDAASAIWGKKWRMPSSEEHKELLDGCDWVWTDDFANSGVAGMIGTSKSNGNTIFVPASGFRMDSTLRERGNFGAYWSSSLSRKQDNMNIMNPSGCALGFYIKTSGALVNWDDRFFGMNVRAVVSGSKK